MVFHIFVGETESGFTSYLEKVSSIKQEVQVHILHFPRPYNCNPILCSCNSILTMHNTLEMIWCLSNRNGYIDRYRGV